MTLDLTPVAIADLKSIRAYTLEKWGPKQEQIYLDSLWSKFEEILERPERFRARNDLFPGCQIAAQGRHVILIRIQNDILQVVRILHSSMDISRHVPASLKGRR